MYLMVEDSRLGNGRKNEMSETHEKYPSFVIDITRAGKPVILITVSPYTKIQSNRDISASGKGSGRSCIPLRWQLLWYQIIYR